MASSKKQGVGISIRLLELRWHYPAYLYIHHCLSWHIQRKRRPDSDQNPILHAISSQLFHVDQDLLLPTNLPPNRILRQHAPQGYPAIFHILHPLCAHLVRLRQLLLHHVTIRSWATLPLELCLSVGTWRVRHGFREISHAKYDAYLLYHRYSTNLNRHAEPLDCHCFYSVRGGYRELVAGKWLRKS